MASSVAGPITYGREKENILGKGAFATVFKGVLNGLPVAVKRVQLVDIEVGNEREMLAMKKLDHPNVVKLYHSHEDGQDFK